MGESKGHCSTLSAPPGGTSGGSSTARESQPSFGHSTFAVAAGCQKRRGAERCAQSAPAAVRSTVKAGAVQVQEEVE